MASELKPLFHAHKLIHFNQLEWEALAPKAWDLVVPDGHLAEEMKWEILLL
jgi:hypothetical protein